MRKRNLVIIPAWAALFVGAYCYRVDRENREFLEEAQASILIYHAPMSLFFGDAILAPEQIDAWIWRQVMTREPADVMNRHNARKMQIVRKRA